MGNAAWLSCLYKSFESFSVHYFMLQRYASYPSSDHDCVITVRSQTNNHFMYDMSESLVLSLLFSFPVFYLFVFQNISLTNMYLESNLPTFDTLLNNSNYRLDS